ncbi:MAG TPA: redoxin domain-containing protein [Bacteroidia bacterium]|mgnify:CR=1 FL=1|nr:redoxin domain-containing protein [Bacteroidia bacterium]
MKKINISLVVVGASILFSACNKQNNASYLSGEIKEGKGKKIYLDQLNSQSAVTVDSALIDEKGHFEFVNFKPSLNFYRIRIEPQNFSILILDSTDKVTLIADVNNLADAKISGSAETDAFLDFNNTSKKYKKQIDSLQQYFQSEIMKNPNDSSKINQLKTDIDKVYQEIVSKWQFELAQKAKQYKDKFASIIALQMLPPQNYLDVYQEIDKSLGNKYPNHPMVQMLHKIVAQQSALSAGSPCPEIALPDPNGKEIRLSSFRGKVVLIDFWASWCKPCRAEMPNVVALYKKYKNKGFEIFGVSLDKDKENWVQAIKEDDITWPQVSDLKFWNSEAVALFNVEAIPYTVLVDKEGKIIAKGLRGADLENAVKKALGI